MINSAAEFVKLRNSDIAEEYFRAAHEEAAPGIWETVLEKYPDMAFWVAQNKTVPYATLDLLAKHCEPRVRSMVATKNKLEEPLLLLLAKDKDECVRMTIARHKSATAKVLNQFIKDSWSEISSLAIERLKTGNHK